MTPRDKKQLQVEIQNADGTMTKATADNLAATQPPPQLDSGEPAADAKPRKTKLDRIEELLNKAMSLMIDYGLEGGTAEDHIKALITEIGNVRASGFKPPRRSKKKSLKPGDKVWVKPAALDDADLDGEWLDQVELVSISEKGVALLQAPSGDRNRFKLGKLSLTKPKADAENGTAS